MKKNKLSKLWRLVFVAIVGLYLMIVIFFVVSLLKIPKSYSKALANQREEIKTELKRAIDKDDQMQYKHLEMKHDIEFVVMDRNNKVIYATVPITDNSFFEKSYNKSEISSEGYFFYKNENGEHSVWLLQYYLSPHSTFNKWLSLSIVSVTLLVIVGFLIVIILFTKFIRPLERLRDKVCDLLKYQLDMLHANKLGAEYDKISKRLIFYIENLEGYIDNSIVEYTTLEKKLQIQNEKLEYKNKQVAALTHDLKGPINIITMQTEKLINEEDDDPKNTIKDINEVTKRLIADINEISQIIYKDTYETKLEEINLVEVILDTLNKYKVKMIQKEFNLELMIDDEIIIKSNAYSIKQIVNNAVSNICAYAPEKSEVIIECNYIDNVLEMKFYNDNRHFSDEELENIFNLFFRYSDDEEGTGTGLYTIKRLVENLNGDVKFINKDAGIELQIKVEIREY